MNDRHGKAGLYGNRRWPAGSSPSRSAQLECAAWRPAAESMDRIIRIIADARDLGFDAGVAVQPA
jgi:hypothetical protein